MSQKECIKKLSICIPTYNRVNYARKQIEKFVSMIMPFQEEVELIISDNASLDGTWNCLKELKERYPLITINRNKTNLGLNGNFLTTTRIANGEYIWMVSDDDDVHENALDKVMEILHKYPDIGLIFLNELTPLKESPVVYTGDQEYFEDGIDMMVTIAKKDNFFNRFTVITEMIQKKSSILEATRIITDNDSFNNFAIPLAWAVYSCANSSALVTKDIFIKQGGDDRTAKSWRESREKFACVDLFKAINIIGEATGVQDRINCDLIINRVKYAEVRWSFMRLVYYIKRNEYSTLHNVALDWMWKHHKLQTILDYIIFPFFVVKRGLSLFFTRSNMRREN